MEDCRFRDSGASPFGKAVARGQREDMAPGALRPGSWWSGRPNEGSTKNNDRS